MSAMSSDCQALGSTPPAPPWCPMTRRIDDGDGAYLVHAVGQVGDVLRQVLMAGGEPVGVVRDVVGGVLGEREERGELVEGQRAGRRDGDLFQARVHRVHPARSAT